MAGSPLRKVRRRRVGTVIGRRLREAREAAGLTQQKLGFKAHLHPTYISMLERGLRAPTVDVLLDLCKAIGIRPSLLLGRIETDLGYR